MYRHLALAAIALTVTSCTVRPTGDGGIAVVPVKDSPVSIKALVTQPESPAPEPSPTPAPEGQCSPATITYGEWLAGSLKGDTPGSRVNVRPHPNLTTTSNSYGLVGEAIAVMGEAVGSKCDRWYRVQFPVSGHQGWVFGDFVAIQE